MTLPESQKIETNNEELETKKVYLEIQEFARALVIGNFSLQDNDTIESLKSFGEMLRSWSDEEMDGGKRALKLQKAHVVLAVEMFNFGLDTPLADLQISDADHESLFEKIEIEFQNLRYLKDGKNDDEIESFITEWTKNTSGYVDENREIRHLS
jgi:hypothetical protein